MEGFGVFLGVLLIVAGLWKVNFLLALFSYHNPFMEMFGKEKFCKGCVVLGMILGVWSLVEMLLT
jgi:hypothetical protein